MAYVSAGSLQNGGSSVFVETFADGTDYTAGTTTQLTLANTPATENTMWVMFDGVVQHHSEYTVSSNVVTFSVAIPSGTSAVEVQNNTELKVGVPGDNTVTTSKIADGAIEYAKLADESTIAMRSKNAIINGNFDVWQRGTSFPTLANTDYTADRFQYFKSGAVIHNVNRSTLVPSYAQSGVRSNYSLLADVSTADASIAAGDYSLLNYTVEGYDYARIAGGDATLSFWVYASKTGIHCISFRNDGTDRSYVAEYTVQAVDTWEKVELTIPLTETGGTWDYTNGKGLRIVFALAVGSTFHTTADAWQTGSFLSTANQVNETDSTANNFRIAQVQLERGDVATNFEYKSIADELSRCQRYYQESRGSTIMHFTRNNGTELTVRDIVYLKGSLRGPPDITNLAVTNAASVSAIAITEDTFTANATATSVSSLVTLTSWTADAEL